MEIRIEPERDLGFCVREARLVIAHEGGTDYLPLSELAEALAPYLKPQTEG